MGTCKGLVCCPINILYIFCARPRLNENQRINTSTGWKTCEIGARQGANRNEVRPRTAEQGPHLWGCDPGAECMRTNNDARSCVHLRGRIPKGAPAPRSGAHTS
jgi:hypothetical protein